MGSNVILDPKPPSELLQNQLIKYRLEVLQRESMENDIFVIIYI